ncbi:MAG TPA: hypothetical protein VG692_07030 [Gemmatimonadales bacterium]|nr:hypothetical protein [Gemmatimonadales bacterium]
MDSAELLMYLSRLVLGYLLPATLTTLGVVGVLSATSVGDAVKTWLRGRREETELLEAMLQELSQIRATLGEATERLDAMERRLSQDRPAPQLPPADAPRAAERSPTPH